MRKINLVSHSRYPIEKKKIRQMIIDYLAKFALTDDYKLSIFVVGDRKMVKLNRRFLSKKGTTDVLSFPLIEFNNGARKDKTFWPKEGFPAGIRGTGTTGGSDLLDLGEIVISYPEARRQAIKKNVTVDKRVDFLIKHGLKHLLGYHHD